MRKALVSGLLILTLIGASVSGAGPVGAEPIDAGQASSFGALGTVMGEPLVGPTASASESAPPFGDDTEAALVDISPLGPITGGGAATATARVHEASDIPSELETETQPLAGPYNAQAIGQTENFEVLLDAVGPGIPLVEADLIRGEAVAKCSAGGVVEYSAQSETQNLRIVDRDELGAALDGILAALFPGLDPFDPLVNVEENVITELPDGIAVDALVVTLFEAANPLGLVQLRIGHAEVSGVTCADTGPVPECSDGIDNDGDGTVDFPADDDCDSPTDPTERPECSDGVDNDDPEDDDADIDDPGCHTDGDPNNPDSFNPNDDNETDGECIDTRDNDNDGGADRADRDCYDGPMRPENFRPDNKETSRSGDRALPKTGTSVPTSAAAGLGLAALAMLALRRRSTTV